MDQKETDKVAESVDDPYMTVNEGLTTDTAMTTDSELAEESKKNDALAAAAQAVSS